MKPDQPFHVGFSYFEEPFLWAMVAHELTEGAVERGIKTTIKGSRSPEDQVRAVEALISLDVDAVVINPVMVDTPKLLPLIDEAKSKGIPVFLVGLNLNGAESLPLVRADNPTGQKQVAEYVFQHLGGKGQVAYIRARGDTMPNRKRVEAFYEVLSRYPDIELVRDIVRDSAPLQVTGMVAPMGGVWAKEIMDAHPKVRAILTPQDNIALGVIDFLQHEGMMKQVVVTGFDGIPAGLKSIQQNQLFASIVMPASDMAQYILRCAVALTKDEIVPLHTLLPVRLVTHDNIAETAASALLFLPRMIEVQQELLSTVRLKEERFRNLVELSSDWYWEQDEDCRFIANDGGNNVFGSNAGLRLWEIPDVEAPEERWIELRELLIAHLPFHDFEVKHTSPDGTVRIITMSGRPIFDKKDEFCGFQGVAKDITERRRNEEQVQALAHYDVLTSLPNRRLFGQEIKRALAQAKRHRRRLAVLFIDLDRFKYINDTLGHEAGDQLLNEISRRLRENLRESDTVSRFGGDEFVILLEDLPDPNHASIVARKLLSEIARPVSLAGGDHEVTGSIGISVFPEDGDDEQTLMKNADIAMYAAKELGKNTFQFYSAQANVHTSERLALESDLRKAVANDELALYYQAKVNLQSGAVTGVEALLRWRHPQLGMVSPAKFIPLAEENGLIVPIGKWVLRTACVQSVEWEKRGIGRLPVAVNLSPRQFYDETLVTDVARIISETGVDPTLLEFEITESMVMRQTDKAVALLMQLREMGISLAIDDFGTGYSSFTLLKRFPIDTIKIDRSFIQGIPGDAENGILTSAIIAMGKALRLKIVAEGVEDEAQVAFLRDLACDQAQGFYFSKPSPADEMTAFLKNYSPSPRASHNKSSRIVIVPKS